MSTLSVLVICVLCVVTSADRIFFRSISPQTGKSQVYVYKGDILASFNETKSWCDILGGKLPTIHSQDDIDFLVDTVTGRYAKKEDEPWVWLNMIRVNNETQWNDNSPNDFSLVWQEKTCRSECCAVFMWLTLKNAKKVHLWSCSAKLRQVCVIEGDSMSLLSLDRLVGPDAVVNINFQMLKSFQTPAMMNQPRYPSSGNEKLSEWTEAQEVPGATNDDVSDTIALKFSIIGVVLVIQSFLFVVMFILIRKRMKE